MKTQLILAAVLFAAGTFLFVNQTSSHDSLYQSQAFGKFEQWGAEFGMKYTSEQERLYRFQIFQEKSEYIEKTNQQRGYEYLAVNKFAQLTDEEFAQTYLINQDQPKAQLPQKSSGSRQTLKDVPVSFDWTTLGKVLPASDAGECAASYAFAATGAVTGLNAVNSTRPLVAYSAQQVVSCTTTYNGGCKGGDDVLSYIYMQKSGLQTAESYPYKQFGGRCDYDESQVVTKVFNAFQIKSEDVPIIEEQVTIQPLTSWIDGSGNDFRFYNGGKYPYDEFCNPQNQVNYVMELVGYNNTDTKRPYWIAQASFGPEWGNNGQMWIEKSSKGPGTCQFQTRVAFPSNHN